MCTGFTIQTLNNQVLLGRTMDYDYPLDGSPAVTPRNYRWTSRTGTTGQTQYGFIGTGTDMEGLFMVMVLMNMALPFQHNISEVIVHMDQYTKRTR